MYYDTDSEIYSTKEGQEEFELADYLGQLMNELEENKRVVEFCSTSPKCYSFKTNKNHKVIHVKGFSLKVLLKVNFHLKNCINNKKRKIEVEWNVQQVVCTETETKKFQFTFDKQVGLDDFTPVPFGFVSDK